MFLGLFEYMEISGVKLIKKPSRILNHIYHYIDSYYTDNFGSQWNEFRDTQIDNIKNTHSYDRFFNETGLKPDDFKNKKVLEVGSGAGRFTNILMKYTHADVHSVDSSNSVYANKINNNNYINDRLNIYKASIYDLPFEENQFDIVICFGVIQHTPNIKKTMDSLCNQVKSDGLIIVDFYPYNGIWTLISAKYIFRPLTIRLKYETVRNFFNKHINKLIIIYKFLDKYKLGLLNRFLPIADISNTLPKDIDEKLLREMVLLDTIDIYTPKYDKPQKIKTIQNMIKSNKFKILFAGKINYLNFTSTVVRGKKY